MDCNSCGSATGDGCDWGNYFSVLDANPDDFNRKGPWTSASWVNTPTDLDAIRMPNHRTPCNFYYLVF